MALLPLGLFGGAVLKAKDRVISSYRGTKSFLPMYMWTDGTERWFSRYDVPDDKRDEVHLVINHPTKWIDL